jgi:hypothetical protein
LNQKAKERRNPEKPYLYVKPEELRKKVVEKQREAQKKPPLSDYGALWSSLHNSLGRE